MLFLIQKFTAISRFASEKYCALCVCFSRKVVFSLPKEVVSYFIPSSDLPLLPPHTLASLFIDKRHHNPRKCLTNTPHPHAYSSVCGHPGVFLPTCCPARGLPLLDDQPSHPLSPCQGTFLVFSPPSVSRVFPTRVQTCFGPVLSRGTFHTDGNILIHMVLYGGHQLPAAVGHLKCG